MAINIRVDRACSPRVPCGMTSIIYAGNSMRAAMQVFRSAEAGLDSWNNRNPSYGVILSVWDDAAGDYIVKNRKGV